MIFPTILKRLFELKTLRKMSLPSYYLYKYTKSIKNFNTLTKFSFLFEIKIFTFNKFFKIIIQKNFIKNCQY